MTWISIKARLPMENQSVLLYDRDGDMHIGHLDVDPFAGKQWIYDHAFEADLERFTHWAELPDGPEEDD